MAYTLEELDDAIAESVGPAMWQGLSGPAFCRPIAMDRAATARWINQLPEDVNALVLREAYSDLRTHGHLRPTEWINEGGKEPWE